MPKLDGAPTGRILEFARERGVPVTLDLIAIDRPDLLEVIAPALPYVDYFMPGLDEARMICGLQDRRRRDPLLSRPRRAPHRLQDGSRRQQHRLARRGRRASRRSAFRPCVSNVVDSTGCGDAYCAGFIVGLLRGWDLVECARLGTAAAGLVISGLGSDAGIVDFDQTLALHAQRRNVAYDRVIGIAREGQDDDHIRTQTSREPSAASSSPAWARSPRSDRAPDELWDRLLAGESGIRTAENLDPAIINCTVRGDVDDSHVPNRFLDGKTLRNTSRFARLAIEAAGEALIDAGLIDGETYEPTRLSGACAAR